MKTLLIGICESSAADAELMIQYLKIAETCLSISLDIHTYSTGKALLESYRPVFDVIFMNVTIPDVDFKMVIEELRRRDAYVSIVLTSEIYDFFSIGYEYSIKNYLIKPLWYSKILNELKKQITDESIISKPYLWISNQQGDYKLYLHKLQYIETSNRKLIFHYGDELIQHNGKLADLQRELPTDFFRCNNSYIVNINYIEKIMRDISRYSIHLITEERIPLSRNKKRELKEILKLLYRK